MDKKIIGYCGAIHRSRSIEVLFQAFAILRAQNPDIELILTGRKERGLSIPDKVRWLGYLSDEKMPLMLNSLDTLVVVNRLSEFGRFSYPVKLYEAMACQIPVVATRTPPAEWILGGRDPFLAKPDHVSDLVEKVKRALPLFRFDYGQQITWEQSSRVFEEALGSAWKTTSRR